MNEKKFICDLKKRRRGALDTAIQQYSGYVASVAGRVLGKARREDLEEIVSDVFVTLWRTAEQLDEGQASVKGYLAAIARHTAVDRLRQRHPETTSLEEATFLADTADEPEAAAIRKEQAAILRHLLLEMSAEDREIFVRFYYYQQTTKEIAAILGKNESTVRARLARGRKKLRERLICQEVAEYAD